MTGEQNTLKQKIAKKALTGIAAMSLVAGAYSLNGCEVDGISPYNQNPADSCACAAYNPQELQTRIDTNMVERYQSPKEIVPYEKNKK